jgi:hypothetical protein
VNGKVRPLKNTAHVTAKLDVGLFVRRWQRLRATGKVGGVIRQIRKGDSYSELRIEDLERLLAIADAYTTVELILDQPGESLTVLEKYARVSAIVRAIQHSTPSTTAVVTTEEKEGNEEEA